MGKKSVQSKSLSREQKWGRKNILTDNAQNLPEFYERHEFIEAGSAMNPKQEKYKENHPKPYHITGKPRLTG